MLIKLFARHFGYEAMPELDLAVLNYGEPTRSDVVYVMLRDQDEMGMWHSETVHYHANPKRRELTLKGATHGPRDLRKVSKQILWDVDEVVDMILRNDDAFTRASGA